MGHALVDLYTKEELEAMLEQSNCLNDLMHRIGYKCVNGNAGKIVKKRLDLLNIDYSKFKLISGSYVLQSRLLLLSNRQDR